MKDKILIASGQGFWGDLPQAPINQVRQGQIDYLVMDYLAEVTMSIMQKQKERNPKLGYAKDLIDLVRIILPECKKKGIKIITNGGGVNPEECAAEIIRISKELGIKIKVGVVSGDNIKEQLPEFIRNGIELNNMESGQPISEILENVLTANVYFGAEPIVACLKEAADIVITGRTTDTGLTLAPMIYEFGWEFNNFNLMAAGTVAGHIIECGAQSSGGNFLGEWKAIDDFAEIGFPIIEAYPSGEFIVTKHNGTGGLVSVATVAEQLVYEIGDPTEYITPECVADFTSIKLKQVSKDRVRVYNIKGSKATEFYKVSAAFFDGYLVTGNITYSYPDALLKAQKADEILRKRLEVLGLKFTEVETQFVGYNACHGPLAPQLDVKNLSEITLRISVRTYNKSDGYEFSRQIAPLILTGPPSVTGFAGGRPKVQEVAAYFPCLIKKSLVYPQIKVFEV